MKILAAITIFRRKISMKLNFKPLKPYIIQEIFFLKNSAHCSESRLCKNIFSRLIQVIYAMCYVTYIRYVGI